MPNAIMKTLKAERILSEITLATTARILPCQTTQTPDNKLPKAANTQFLLIISAAFLMSRKIIKTMVKIKKLIPAVWL